jgi:hypothetical protein
VNSEHIQTGTLRDYLLQTLSDKETEMVEERYFTDGGFFKELRTAEVRLICDYLDGRLSGSERRRFQSLYRRTPALRALVEEVRLRRAVPRRSRRVRLLQVAMAGTLACAAILAITMFLHDRAKKTRTSLPTASVETTRPELILILTPGVTKGAGPSTPVLTPPDVPQDISLLVELPGEVSSASYVARLSNADMEGSQRIVWMARGISSAPKDGGQRVTVKLPSAKIPPGDYILELESEGSHTTEAYVFRVTRPPKTDKD